MSLHGGVEVWRGGVNTWQCDDMGRLNVRHFVAHAVEGLVGVAAALDLVGAFKAHSPATLLIRDHHIRFLREVRVGAQLHMIAGLLDLGECDARLIQLLIHSLSGEVAASFQTRVVHVTAGDERPFPWSANTRRRAEGLAMAIPEGAGPRRLDATSSAGRANLADAARLGMIRIASGAIGVADCDVFGRMRPEMFIGRVSDGVQALGLTLRAGDALGPATRQPGIGGADLEYRVAYQRWPRAGDRFEIRSGLAAVGERTQNLVHWLLDPASGRAWGSSEAVTIALDLEARKVVAIPSDEQARLRARVLPGLTF